MTNRRDDDDLAPGHRAKGSLPLPPTLDPDEQGRRSLALIDAITDEAVAEACEGGGPIDPRAHRILAVVQRRAAQGREQAVLRERLAAGTGAPGDGAPQVTADPVPDTAQIRRMDRRALERLVLEYQRRRGQTPAATFEGIEDHELVQLARHLRPA